MVEFVQLQEKVRVAREERDLAQDQLQTERGRLHQSEKQVEHYRREGNARPDHPKGGPALEEKNTAELRVKAALDNLVQKKMEVTAAIQQFNQQALEQQVSQLNDDTPFLLFPVRLETRFRTVPVTVLHDISVYEVRGPVKEVLTEMEKATERFKATQPQRGAKAETLEAMRTDIVSSIGSVQTKLANISEVNPREMHEIQTKETALITEASALESRVNNIKRISPDSQRTADQSKRTVQQELQLMRDNLRKVPMEPGTGGAGSGTVIASLVRVTLFSVKQQKQLWVRIYPDDIAIDTHEKELTQDEIDAGKAYWTEIWYAPGNAVVELGAWRALTAKYGPERAAWIAKRLTPTNKDKTPSKFAEAELASEGFTLDITDVEAASGIEYWDEVWDAGGNVTREKAAWTKLKEEHQSPRAERIAMDTRPLNIERKPVHEVVEREQRIVQPERPIRDIGRPRGEQPVFPFPGRDEEPIFPNLQPKPNSWSRAPYSKIMPDRFAVRLYSKSTTEEANGSVTVTFTEKYKTIGNSIPDPLPVGLDPNGQDAFTEGPGGTLNVDPDIKWMTDFEEAVKAGMAMKIDISDADAAAGFDRVLVLGLKLSATKEKSKALLEDLFDAHHYTHAGLSIVPQGTPTNNTDKQESGFRSIEQDASISLGIERKGPLFTRTSNLLQRTDGQWLSDLLGVSETTFQNIRYANGTDHRDALIMNQALYPSTWGVFLEEMLNSAFLKEYLDPNDPSVVKSTYNDLGLLQEMRRFFVWNVTGRGPMSAIRTGTQPYGILPTTAYSKWNWDSSTTMKGLHQWLQQMDSKWKDLAETKVKHVGYDLSKQLTAAQTADTNERIKAAQQNFLEMVGLHASSVEFHYRYAAGYKFLQNIQSTGTYQKLAQFLAHHGITEDDPLTQELYYNLPESDIFKSKFFAEHSILTGKLVDSKALSEQTPLAYNYVNWLLNSSIWDIRYNRMPNADAKKTLMYMMLRHSTILSYWDAAMRILVKATDETDIDFRQVYNYEFYPHDRQEEEFFNRFSSAHLTTSKWSYLFHPFEGFRYPTTTPEAGTKLAYHLKTIFTADNDYSNTSYAYKTETADLREVRKALKLLAALPTAKLERAFTEHLDLASYRLDAWKTGMVNMRLQQQRQLAPQQTRKTGIYIGAFGWLEDLRPSTTVINHGYIHAPSINHAVTAGVLRSGYMANNTGGPGNNLMAVNLTSERVRKALFYIEGVRNGQPLAALLGYKFERGLHEHASSPVDQYIYDLRQRFPLVSGQLNAVPGSAPIEAVEANNVVDGLALLKAANSSAVVYTTWFNALSATAQSAINAEVAKLNEDMDSIGDLSLAESVFQVTQGNHERAGAVMKAITLGENIPEPEVIKTPRTGRALTQRVILDFDLVADVTQTASNPWAGKGSWTAANPNPWTGATAAGVTLTARARAEASLNKWLGIMLGDPDRVKCTVYYKNAAQVQQQHDVSLTDLDLQPADILELLTQQPGADSDLAKLVAYYTRKKNSLPDTTAVDISFDTATGNAITFMQLLPLAHNLNTILSGSRPLMATDMVLSNDVITGDNPKGYAFTSPTSGTLEIYTRFVQTYTEFKAVQTNLTNAKNASPRVAHTLRLALIAASRYGIAGAIPIYALSTGVDAVAALASQADQVLSVMAQRVAEITALKAENINAASNPNSTKSVQDKVSIIIDAFKVIFGRSFTVIPHISLAQKPIIKNAVDNRSAILPQGRVLPGDEWMQGVSVVRKKMHTLESVYSLVNAFQPYRTGQADISSLTPVQVPYKTGDYWLGIEFPANSTPIEDEKLSLVMQMPFSGFDENANHAGLLVDEWVEVLPSEKETTGIAFHYDAPNSCAPQSLLLAVTPEITGSWEYEDLVDTLHETLDMAKKRAVEPDQLDKTFYAQVLPAIMGNVSFQEATLSVDFGTNNGTAMYEPVDIGPDPDAPSGGTGTGTGTGTAADADFTTPDSM